MLENSATQDESVESDRHQRSALGILKGRGKQATAPIERTSNLTNHGGKKIVTTDNSFYIDWVEIATCCLLC